MMEFESAVRRLAAEQDRVGAAIRRKRREEEAAKRGARERREAAVAQAVEAERVAAEAAEAAARARQEEVERNNGVVWSAWLRVVRLDEGEDAVGAGIRRRADKVVLAPAVEVKLMAQDAAARTGALLFEIRAGEGAEGLEGPDAQPGADFRGEGEGEGGGADADAGAGPRGGWGESAGAGRRLWCTHAGVLNFKGADGCVGVPSKVARCLGPYGKEGSRVLVKFTRLPKGEFAALQPETRDFARDVGDVRGALEDVLHRHATLTVGDVLSVPFDGAEYRVRVLGLRGAGGAEAGAVSVVDTDLEVELTESAQYARAFAAERAAEAAREAEAARAEAEVERQEAEHQKAARLAESARASLRASLPPEPCAPPPNGDEASVEVAVRMPDGRMMRRRFPRGGEAAALFRFVAAEAPGEAPPDPDSVTLVKPLSRTVLLGRDCAHQTFESLGFDVRESLMYHAAAAEHAAA